MNILRCALGLFFILFGITKIVPIAGFGYGFDGTVWFVGEAMGYAMPEVIVGIAIVTEIILGLSLLLPQWNGFCHKRQLAAAFVLGMFTLAATILFHLPGVSGESMTTELTNVLKNLVIVAALFAVGSTIEDETKNRKAYLQPPLSR